MSLLLQLWVLKVFWRVSLKVSIKYFKLNKLCFFSSYNKLESEINCSAAMYNMSDVKDGHFTFSSTASCLVLDWLRGGAGINPGHTCQPSCSEFSMILTETHINTV